MSFWSVTYVDWPPLAGTPQRRIHAICDRAGTHCYVFRENTLTPYLSADLDTLVHRFDTQFVPKLTSVYGPIPNALDNDTHVFILVIDEPNWCGYFDPAQQMTDNFVFSKWASHSSEHEIIYVAGNCFSDAPFICAHEFGHMLHWLQDHSPEPIVNPTHYWEDAWIDESFSTFASIYLTENIFQADVLDDQAFFATDADIPLIYFSNYNQVKLWSMFMFEHYGGWNYISALISNQLNGIAGMDSSLRQMGLTENFNDAFLHWSITNYLDDATYEGGKYAYVHYNFPACAITASYSTYPTGVCNQTVNPYGTDYITFSSSTPTPTAITFDGDSSSKFRLALIKMNTPTNVVKSVDNISVDNYNHAVITLDSLGSVYNKVILVVCNVDSAIHEGAKANYSYYTTNITGIVPSDNSQEIHVFPNPANTMLTISYGSSHEEDTITLYDVLGNMVYQSLSSSNRLAIDISKLMKGVYTLKSANSHRTIYNKIIKE